MPKLVNGFTSSISINKGMNSEGGTGENPHLNFGKTIVIFGKNWFQSSPRLKKGSDPHLDKIRSTLTGDEYNLVLSC